MTDNILAGLKPHIIKGSIYADERGSLKFVNDFMFYGIKRFYTITHPDPGIIRAWQGHRTETKHFFVTKGSFLICWVEIDNWESPSKNIRPESIFLNAEEPQLLIIPPGYANGFKAMQANSTLLVFSNKSIEDSTKDLIRFPSDHWSLG